MSDRPRTVRLGWAFRLPVYFADGSLAEGAGERSVAWEMGLEEFTGGDGRPALRVAATAAASAAPNTRPAAAGTGGQIMKSKTTAAASPRKLTPAQAAERDRYISVAIAEGRFMEGRRKIYEEAWASDPEGTRRLLTASPSEGGLAVAAIPAALRTASAAAVRRDPGYARVRASMGIRSRGEIAPGADPGLDRARAALGIRKAS